MKKVFLFGFLFFTMIASGQSDLQLNIKGQIGKSYLGVDREYIFESRESDALPLVWSIDVSVEMGRENQRSILLGLRYAEMNFLPDYEMTFFYGGMLLYEGDSVWVNTPHLKKLEYQTISIPLAHRHYFNVSERFSCYLHTGVATTFQIHKNEVFDDYVYSEALNETVIDVIIEASDTNLKFFGTHFELGAGFGYKIKPDLTLNLHAQIHVLEYRRYNPASLGLEIQKRL